MNQILRFYGSVKRDPAISAWMNEHSGELGAIARLRPDGAIDATALIKLVESAYADMKRRVEAE